jgi:NAD(P)-dependent dehydrogenase (short-subunit alcohol dehydrogenase family)
MGRLQDRIALVTGSGNGIGKATAELFAAEGAVVYVADVVGDAAHGVAAAIVASGGRAHAVICDVTRGQDVMALFRMVSAAHGRLDVLVNNAGLNVRADFRHLTDAEWERIREVNLDGVVRIARDGFALLQASGRGSLINVASVLGSRGMRQLVGYAVTKGAVAALTRGLAVEYAPFGIRVNTISPGFVQTALTKQVLRNPAVHDALVAETAMRRLGEPIEIARAVLFFASDDSAYCTGSELVVDGGMTASL